MYIPVLGGAMAPAHLRNAANLPPPDLELLAVGDDADVVVASGDEADGELHVALGVAAVVVMPGRLPGEYLLEGMRFKLIFIRSSSRNLGTIH